MEKKTNISILPCVSVCRAPLPAYGPSLVAQMVKNLPAKQETRIREDPLEEEDSEFEDRVGVYERKKRGQPR